MERLKWFGIVLTLMALVFPLSLAAGENTTETYDLGNMVISATRNEASTFDTPQSVSVVTHEEVMASPFERIEDILRDVVGYENYSHYGQQTRGVASHFSMRGVGRNRTLMLLDGVPLNDNFSNTITWVAWGLIPKETIERIEIVRGPTSATYGSEGLGGVIHIITKKPAEQKEGHASFTAGTAKTYKGSGYYSQKSGKWGLLLSGGYETSDGLYMADPEDLEDYSKRRHRDVGKIFGKATYDLGERTDMDFSALYYDHEMGKGREYFYDDAQLEQYRLTLSHRGDSMDWSGVAFFNKASKTANIDDKSTHDRLARQEMFPSNKVWGVNLQNTARLKDQFFITSGLDFKRVAMDYDEDYTDSDRDFGATGRQDTLAPFVDMTGHFFGKKLIVNAGVRYSNIRNYDGRSWDTAPPNRDPFDIKYDSETWDNFSPKAGVVYHPDSKTALRASLGTGFKTPSLFDLYKVHSRSKWSIRWANPELEPEEILTWDVGGERYVLDDLRINLAYYQSKATDYIGSRTVDEYEIDGNTYRETMYDNISEVDIEGVEAEMEYDFGYGLKANLNYTLNLSKIAKDEVDQSLEGNYLSSSPRHKYRARLTYKNPSLISGSVSARYDAHIYADNDNTEMSDDYFSLDLSLWRTFFDKLTLRLNIENVTDETEYVEDGTLYYGSVSYEFF